MIAQAKDQSLDHPHLRSEAANVKAAQGLTRNGSVITDRSICSVPCIGTRCFAHGDCRREDTSRTSWIPPVASQRRLPAAIRKDRILRGHLDDEPSAVFYTDGYIGGATTSSYSLVSVRWTSPLAAVTSP